ncbi:MAG: imidazole glycerol phosphate synthase subunit HisF [Desulfovibrionaceae bacterium]|nr:imidazole glycerol phosphate synthase subunit HisF [Desulfovibrionaceae bacterium]
MVRPRLIPCLLLKNGLIVRSEIFRIHQVIGNPMSTVERFSHWNVDELVLLDISREDFHDLRRDDLQQQYSGSTALNVLREVSKVCFMPLAFGGRIRSLEDIRARLEAGADKCVVNTRAVEEPGFIAEAAKRFGGQCVVVSIDALRHEDGRREVFIRGGREATGLDPAEWAARVEKLGAGEIFLNSVDRDGTAQGYDLELVRKVVRATTIPVIACGGAGRYNQLAPGILEAGASAVSAANLFHFFELSYPFAKKACLEAGIPMRPVKLGGRWFRREPGYAPGAAENKIRARLDAAAKGPSETSAARRKKVSWCAQCVYPTSSAVPLEFDEAGVCMGCRVAKARKAIPASEWTRRREILGKLLERYRSRDGSAYDCVIAVSGGKDSYYLTHVIKNEYGLNPLLATYDANNWTPTGWENLLRMKEVFGADHVIYSPSVGLLKKLNRLAFMVMGDMNWHGHLGIMTAPVRAAAQHGVSLVIYGEHGYMDLGGQFSMDDFQEITYRARLEHFARGYEWNYFLGAEGIAAQDMLFYQYPSDQTLFDQDIRGIYLGNYLNWDAYAHTRLVSEKYGWKPSPVPFERTYRRISNLDDMHENGGHDYLKYIKFGYGRCTDHVCKDIRSGSMTREQGVELVRRYDHVKPSDLERWFKYTGVSEEQFARIADTFRDPRVWSFVDGRWVKDNLWDHEEKGHG